MSTSAHLAVSPEKCDRCGRCVRACPGAHLKVGGGYIYVDTSQCTGCMACVETCDRGAIVRRSVPNRPTASASISSADVARVVVGSRAEAKALRKAAANADKHKAAATKSAKKADARGVTGKKEAGKKEAAVPGVAGVWTIADAGALVAVLFACLVLRGAILGSQAVAVMPPSAELTVRALVTGLYYAALLGVLAFLAHRRDLKLADAVGLRTPSRGWVHVITSVGLVAGLVVATRLASAAWGAIAQAVGWVPVGSEDLTALFGLGGAGLFLTTVMVVILGPFAEEVVFRGVVMRALGTRLSVWPAIVGSAALFALFHGNAWVFVPTFILGVACGWLVAERDSLWPAVALHASYNLLVVAAAYWVAH